MTSKFLEYIGIKYLPPGFEQALITKKIIEEQTFIFEKDDCFKRSTTLLNMKQLNIPNVKQQKNIERYISIVNYGLKNGDQKDVYGVFYIVHSKDPKWKGCLMTAEDINKQYSISELPQSEPQVTQYKPQEKKESIQEKFTKDIKKSLKKIICVRFQYMAKRTRWKE